MYWSLNRDYGEGDGPAIWDVFKKYKWEKIPSELRDAAYISSFLTQHGLQSISIAPLISWEYTQTIEERVGLEKKQFGYGLLSEEDKKNFLRDLQAALEANLGQKTYFTSQQELHICYGYKR